MARELQEIMQRINNCSSAAKKARLALHELQPRFQAALDAGEPPTSKVMVNAKGLLENLERIAKLLVRNKPVLLLRKKRLELENLTKQVAAAWSSGPRLDLFQKLRSCMKRVVAAGVPTTSPEVMAADKLVQEIQQAFKLSKLQATVKRLSDRVSRAEQLEQQLVLAHKHLSPAIDRALQGGVSDTSPELIAADTILTQIELRSRLEKITQTVAAASKPEPRLSLCRTDLEPQISRVLAAGLTRKCAQVVAAQRLLDLVEAEIALTPRGAEETPRRVEQVAESAQKLEAMHSDASRQGIVGTAVIADLFESALHALHALEQHTDARQTPSDGLQEFCCFLLSFLDDNNDYSLTCLSHTLILK